MRTNDAVFNAFDKNLNVKIERRDDFDATTERETISIQNICFLDVANEVIKNEIFEIVFDKKTNNVNINVDSFDEKNVAKNINIAIDAMNIRFAIIVFDVKKNVNITIIAFDVSIDATNNCFDVKKDVNIAIIANVAFDENITIFLTNLICCCNIALY